MTDEERRIHARIETELPCTIVGGKTSVPARMVDLSRGGAQLIAAPGIAAVGDSLTLEVQLPTSPTPVTILGEVFRIEGEAEESRYALRFSIVEPKQREDLTRFLTELLAGKGIGRRSHPRVYRRIPVRFRTARELRAVMDNISRGGMGVECDAPLVVDETVIVDIGAEGIYDSVEIDAVVTHVRSISGDRYQVGLQFVSLTKAKQDQLDGLIERLLEHSGSDNK